MRSYPWYTFISLDQPRILTNRGGQMCGQREPWHFSSPNTRCKDVSQLMRGTIWAKITEASVFRCRGCCSSLDFEHRSYLTSNFGSPTCSIRPGGQKFRASISFCNLRLQVPSKNLNRRFAGSETTYGVFICSTVGFHQQKGGWITSGSCLLNVTCNRPVMWFGFVKWHLKTAGIWWLTSGLGVADLTKPHPRR